MITLNQVTKSYNHSQAFAVKDVTLNIPKAKTLVLLGSSGSGKTTLLKMINRLIEPTAGTVEIDGKNVQHYQREKLRHSIGYVFQKIGLFPHLNIENNISIVLRLMKKSLMERKKRANELLEMMHLDPLHYASRYPHELSGGEQQRVGVARALAADPEYLLMDEPFAALDAISREILQDEILNLKKQLNKTIVFVTHDITEAFKLADQIGIMHKGYLEQIGTPDTIRKKPASPFVQKLIEKFRAC